MSKKEENGWVAIEGLERLLEVHGADRSRWPARERLKYSALIAESAEARRRVAESEALDAILDRMPEPSVAGLDTLTSRIMAAAEAESPAGARSIVLPIRRPGKPLRKPAETGELGWSHAALLAASVLVGVFSGTAGLFIDPLQPNTPAIEAAEQDTSDDASRYALGSDDSQLIDVEDTL